MRKKSSASNYCSILYNIQQVSARPKAAVGISGYIYFLFFFFFGLFHCDQSIQHNYLGCEFNFLPPCKSAGYTDT